MGGGAKIDRFADAARTGTNGALGVWEAAEANRRPACKTVFCMELARAFMMVLYVLLVSSLGDCGSRFGL
jgi:hypothetical protein